MSKLLDFFSNFFKKVGLIFSSLTKGAEKVWDNTEPEIQKALQKASEIVAVINKYKKETPDFIFTMIQAKIPDFSKEKIEELMAEVNKDLSLVQDGVTPDLMTTIQNVADYLNSRSDSKWAKASQDVAEFIAIFLAPSGTVWNKIGTIMWYVYQRYVKGKV